MRRLLAAAGLGVRVRRWTGVRLGRLAQHPPRPLCVATLARAGGDVDLPAISLVTPSYNQGSFVARTIDSVLAQSYPRLQYVVQDGLSQDSTESVLAAYAGRGIDIRREADAGQSDALNRGFAAMRGEIMGYLNSDDVLLPGALHLVGSQFRDHPEIDVIYGNRLIVDENDREIGRWILPGHDADVLRCVDYVPQETLYWRRSIWEAAGGRFDPTLQFAMDWDLLLRFLDAGARFAHVPELLGVFRVHDAQKSQSSFLARGAGEMAALRARHRDRRYSAVRRLAQHGRFLLEHRKADAAFLRGL